MSKSFIVLPAETKIPEALSMMNKVKARHVIVASGKRLDGYVRLDLLHLQGEARDQTTLRI